MHQILGQRLKSFVNVTLTKLKEFCGRHEGVDENNLKKMDIFVTLMDGIVETLFKWTAHSMNKNKLPAIQSWGIEDR